MICPHVLGFFWSFFLFFFKLAVEIKARLTWARPWEKMWTSFHSPNKSDPAARTAVRPRRVSSRQSDSQAGRQEEEVKGKMSGLKLLLLSLTLCSLWTAGGSLILPDALERGPLSLNDMFREVGELMEDTQHILEEAVDQVCVTFYSATRTGRVTALFPHQLAIIFYQSHFDVTEEMSVSVWFTSGWSFFFFFLV